MNEDEQLRRAEQFFEQFLNPTPGVPVLARSPLAAHRASDSPKRDILQHWKQDAVRLGFDPEEVRLVYDGKCFGIRRWRRFANEVPEALVDATIALWARKRTMQGM